MNRNPEIQKAALRLLCVAGVAATGVFPSGNAIAEEILCDELKQCSVIEVSSERLDCFDNFVGRHAETVRAALAETKIQQAPDDLGAETLPLGARGDIEKLAVRAVVTSCRKNSLGKYFFFFDNGHVWKQTNNKRLRFTKCEFDVTITQDFFGYKMQRVGDSSQIRIARIK